MGVEVFQSLVYKSNQLQSLAIDLGNAGRSASSDQHKIMYWRWTSLSSMAQHRLLPAILNTFWLNRQSITDSHSASK